MNFIGLDPRDGATLVMFGHGRVMVSGQAYQDGRMGISLIETASPTDANGIRILKEPEPSETAPVRLIFNSASSMEPLIKELLRARRYLKQSARSVQEMSAESKGDSHGKDFNPR